MTTFSRTELQKRNAVSAKSRELFRSIVSQLAELDEEGFSHIDDFEADPFAQRAIVEARSGIKGDFNLFRTLDRFRSYELECPKDFRRKVSPRLDFTGCETYANVCQAVFTALIKAGEPWAATRL